MNAKRHGKKCCSGVAHHSDVALETNKQGQYHIDSSANKQQTTATTTAKHKHRQTTTTATTATTTTTTTVSSDRISP
jgi:hypothetical protein